MEELTPQAPTKSELGSKIASLVRERGWNQEDFARIAQLNRQTVRDILFPTNDRKLRNTTILACAKALGLGVSELIDQPLERLLPRMHAQPAPTGAEHVRRLYERATQPELLSWMERNPERASQLTPEEIDDLLSIQGTGGPLTTFGVEHYVEQLERRRRLHQQIDAIAGTEYLDVVEKLVGLIFEKVQPYRDRM